MAVGERVKARGSFVPVFCIAYAIWTIFVQAITATHSSFDTLLRWLPVVVLTAIVATVAWLCQRPFKQDWHEHAGRCVSTGACAANEYAASRCLWVVTAVAAGWVGLLSVGLPYALFWWVCVAALIAAWILAGGPGAKGGDGRSGAVSVAQWLVVAGIVVGAVCVTLLANRPDLDDAFYMSVPATLLRFPMHAVLGGDTMYRAGDLPLLLPIYRLDTYEVLVGTVSRLTGIPHLRVAYEVLPPLFAVVAVLVWKQLLHLLVPDRWLSTLVVLFLVMLALGEAHTAYGNFAFVRMFQGKALFATVMIPAIAYSALVFSRHTTARNWMILFAAQVGALGFTSSALFAAPAAAGMALASQWMPDLAGTRRLLVGVAASAYVFAAAGVMLLVTHGGHGFVSDAALPPMLVLIQRTWGSWSTALLLFAMLSAWVFAEAGMARRYLLVGGLLFLLGVLNPYTSRFVADHVTGLSTYWRLTWALPLPFFVAITCVGIGKGAMRIRPRVFAVLACGVLVATAVAFGWRCGTLRSANFVTLGVPGLKVDRWGYPVAKQVARTIPEDGIVLAPEGVATWLPTFTVHPGLLAVRTVYLASGFGSAEAARRQALIEFVSGQKRLSDSLALLQHAIDHYHLTCIVVLHRAAWEGEIADSLDRAGWRRVSTGTYDVWERGKELTGAKSAVRPDAEGFRGDVAMECAANTHDCSLYNAASGRTATTRT